MYCTGSNEAKGTVMDSIAGDSTRSAVTGSQRIVIIIKTEILASSEIVPGHFN